MFGLMLIFAVTVQLAYVLWRASAVTAIARLIPRRALALLGFPLAGLFWLGLWLGHDAVGGLAATLGLAALIAMVWLFLTAASLAVVDLCTAFGLLFRARVSALRGGAMIAGAALAVIALVQGLRPPAVTDYEARVRRLPPEADGLTIVALADLHLGARLDVDWQRARLAQVAALKPDLVALLGDIYEGHRPPDPATLGAWRTLSPPLGVWFVPGNHESHRGGERTPDLLAAAGVRVLRGQWAQLQPGLVIAGVDFPRRRRGGAADVDPVAPALVGRPPGAVVLLSHSPEIAEAAARAGVDLMLSGHTHGGQVWPFNFVIRFFYPIVAGQGEVGGMPLIVSRGAGTWGPPMRLWRRGEIARITLRAG